MNHENRVVRIDDEDDLKEAAIYRPAPDELPFISLNEWKRTSGAGDDLFRFFRIDSVIPDMLDVPGVPAKVHLGALTIRLN